MTRMPRGQGLVLVLFIACALVGVALVSGFKTFERGASSGGLLWALLAVVGILLGFAAFHLLRKTRHPQEP